MHDFTPNLNRLILGILSLCYVILPFFELKIILLGIFFFLTLHLLKNGKTISKASQIFFLVLLYTLSFLSVPYWSLKSGVTHVTISFLILIAGYTLFVFGCYKNTSDLKLPRFKDNVGFYFGVLFVSAVILNYLPMLNSINYRGDADYHIRVTMGFFLYLTDNMYYLYLFLLLLLISLWSFVSKRNYFIFLIPLCVLTFCILSHFFYFSTFPSWIKRYPSLFYLFNIIFSIPFTSVFIQNQIFIESNYRIFILTCTVIIAVFAVSRINSTNGLLKVLIGLYILTLPVLHYYASLAYIDLVMILFAFIAVFNFEKSIHWFFEKNTIDHTFFFIILLGFIKETSLVYLLVFFFFAGYILYYRTNHDTGKKIYLWANFAIITLTPLFVFLYFRDVPHNPYHLNLKNLFVLGNYKILFVSLWEQFGLLLPASILSMLYLLIRKKYFPVIFNLCLIIGYVSFFMLNGKISSTFINHDLYYTGTAYFGYSRFNLVFIPCFLTLLISSINLLKGQYEKIAVFVFVLLIVSNQMMSPINFISGLRKPGWGDYTVWTSEYDYPYNEAYRWISNHPEVKAIGIIGRTYPYFDLFYHQKYNLNFNLFRVVSASDKTKKPEVRNLNYILYHKEPEFYSMPDSQTLQILTGYNLIKEFNRGDLSLALYMKNNN